MRPNVASGALDAPNATLGALSAPNATLGLFHRGCGWSRWVVQGWCGWCGRKWWWDGVAFLGMSEALGKIMM
jgi:hypothetical protein